MFAPAARIAELCGYAPAGSTWVDQGQLGPECRWKPAIPDVSCWLTPPFADWPENGSNVPDPVAGCARLPL